MGFITVAVATLVHYHWSRRRQYLVAMKFPGPPALPLIGNAWFCYRNPEGTTLYQQLICWNILYILFYNVLELLYVIHDLALKYDSPFRMWFGPYLVLYFNKPEHLEVN